MKYTKTFRNSVLRKVLPPENRSISSVAKETGIAAVTISSWLAKVRNGTLNLESDEDGPSSERNMKEKLNLLLEYQKVTNENEGEWLRQNGLHSEHLTLFKQELSDIVTDKDLNPHEIYHDLLDKGVYLASESSFYRILRKKEAITHRTESKEGISRVKPEERIAAAPNEVWMWDITWIKSPVTGVWFYAYVIIHLFNRSVFAWAIHDNESETYSTQLFRDACRKHPCTQNFVHSDNGNPMQKRRGEHIKIFAERNETLVAAKDKFPKRWGKRATGKFIVKEQEVLNSDQKKSA